MFLSYLLGRPITPTLFEIFVASKDVSNKPFKRRALFFNNKIAARCVRFLRFLRELFILFTMAAATKRFCASIFKEMNFYLFVFSETSFPNKQGGTILCNIFIPAARMYLLIGSLFI